MRCQVVVVAAIMLMAMGCVTKNTVTESDRVILDLTRQATEKAVIDMQKGILAAGVVQGGPASVYFGAALVSLSDVQKNMVQQLKVHGGPKVPKEYTPATAEAERQKSDKEHSGNGWIWTVLNGVAWVGATLLGMPFLARLFPVLTGPVGRIAQAGIQAIVFARKRAEENGGSISVQDLLSIAKDENVLAGVQEIVKTKAKALEEKLGLDLQMSLNSPAPEAPVAPAPETPQPPAPTPSVQPTT